MAIFYSVGTDTSELYSGNASASSGTLTLEGGPAADKIGVGDEIREGSNRYYITGRNSTTEFTIQDSAANGGTPGDTNITFGSTSISIYRAFNKISSAVSGSGDSGHLNLTAGDLVTPNYQLNWPCYKDAPLDEQVNSLDIDGYTTGAANYIRIYTPVDSSEVGTSQRHTGIAGTGFVLKTNYSGTQAWLLYIYEDYVRVEGIEIDGSLMSVAGINGIKTKDVSNTDSDIRIDKVLIHDLTKNDSEASGFEGRGIYVSDGKVRITNSIIYNVTNNNSDPDATSVGIHFNGGPSSSYNNTIYNVVNNGSSAAVYGLWVQTGTATVTNTYAGGTSCSSCGASNYDFSGTMTANYNVSEDDTADDNAGTGNLISKAPANQFVSPEDLRTFTSNRARIASMSEMIFQEPSQTISTGVPARPAPIPGTSGRMNMLPVDVL
jgi:hypothetical protein